MHVTNSILFRVHIIELENRLSRVKNELKNRLSRVENELNTMNEARKKEEATKDEETKRLKETTKDMWPYGGKGCSKDSPLKM
jgi:hypothetical protein